MIDFASDKDQSGGYFENSYWVRSVLHWVVEPSHLQTLDVLRSRLCTSFSFVHAFPSPFQFYIFANFYYVVESIILIVLKPRDAI